MTIRVDHKLKKVFVRLHPGEAFYRQLGSSYYYSIPGDEKFIGIAHPQDYTLEATRAKPKPPGWRVVK